MDRDLPVDRQRGRLGVFERSGALMRGVGNPPAMIELRDGRICLLYGYRAEPYSIRAVLSGDRGRTWSEPRHAPRRRKQLGCRLREGCPEAGW